MLLSPPTGPSPEDDGGLDADAEDGLPVRPLREADEGRRCAAGVSLPRPSAYDGLGDADEFLAGCGKLPGSVARISGHVGGA